MYAIIQNNQIIEWPIHDLRARYPNTSFPSPIKPSDLPDGVVEIKPASPPTYDSITHELRTGTPVFNGIDWVQGYDVLALSDEQVQTNQAAAAKAFQDEIVRRTQQRLDDFARTRNYDGILSAATYAPSTNLRFKLEGEYAVSARDQTWGALYTLLEQVQLGLRPPPTSYSDIEPLLPQLTWPN